MFQVRFRAGPNPGEELRASQVRLRRLLALRDPTRHSARESSGGLVQDGTTGRPFGRGRQSITSQRGAGREGGRHEHHAESDVRQYERARDHDRYVKSFFEYTPSKQQVSVT